MTLQQGEQAREVTGTPHGGAEQIELAEVEVPHVEVCVLGAGVPAAVTCWNLSGGWL